MQIFAIAVRRLLGTFQAILALAACGSASAVTIDAGDITRLPEGASLALLYVQHFEGDKLYVAGDKASDDAALRADIGIARFVHYKRLDGLLHALQVLQPFGKLAAAGDLDGARSTNGVGDLILVDTIHLMNDPEGKRAFVVTPWLWLPTGRYDRNNALNAFGENRWKFALQTGYMTPVAGGMLLDLLADVTFFGDNDDFGPGGATLEQRPMFELQAHLRYPLSPSTYVSPALSHAWGGETRVDGVDRNDRQRRTKLLLSIGHFFAPTWQVLGSVGKDLSVRTGVQEDLRINLRLLKLF